MSCSFLWVLLLISLLVPSYGAQPFLTIPIKGAGLPLALYERVMFAYSFVDSSLLIDYAGTGSGSSKAALMNGEIEFGCSDSLLTSAHYAAVPDLQMYPSAAAGVVPVFNLPELSGHPQPLVLSRDTWALIFLGNITFWDDPRITADNPTGAPALPHRPITLLIRSALSGHSGITHILKQSLASFSVEFGAKMRAAALEADTASEEAKLWPPTATLITSPHATALSSRVLLQPYSLSYTVLGHARQLGVPVASMVNRAGYRVSASTASVGLALAERGGQLDARFNAALVDAYGSGAWPMCVYTYLILRRNTTISTCATRRRALRFWEWYYTSAVPVSAAAALGFAVLPPRVSDRVLRHLRQHVLCPAEAAAGGDGRVLPSAVATLRGGGVPTLSRLMAALLQAYATVAVDVDTSYSGSSAPAHALLGSVAAGQQSFAVILQGRGNALPSPSTSASPAALATAAGDATPIPQGLSSLPLGVQAMVLKYHRSSVVLSDSGSGGGGEATPLVLDVAAVCDILAGSISRWDDPRLQALNPSLTLAPQPIVTLTRSDESATTLAFTRSLARLAATTAAGSTPHSPPPVVSRSTGSWSPAHPLPQSSEQEVMAAVAFIPHTLGILSMARDSSNPSYASLRFRPAGAAEQHTVTLQPSVAAAGACVADGSEDGATLPSLAHAATAASAAAAGCWPLSAMVTVVHPSSYATPSQCSSGTRTAELLFWMYQGENVRQLVLWRVAPLSPVNQRSVRAALRALTCSFSGQRLLQRPDCGSDDFVANVSLCDVSTLTRTVSFSYTNPDPVDRRCVGPTPNPIVFSCASLPVESMAAKVVIAVAAFVSLLCLALVVVVAVHRDAPVIAYSQPRFCHMFLMGVLLSSLSAALLVGPNTDALCVLRVWTVPLAFTLMFGTLFLKVHRAYQLLNNPSLRRFKITAGKLYARLSAMLAVDVLLLLWHTLPSPGGAHTVPLRVTSLGELPGASQTLCKHDASGALSVLMVYKVTLVLGGTVLSVKAWNLQSHMAEAKHIAIAIYNLTFVGAVLALLTFAVTLPYSALKQFQALALLWANFVSVTMLFVPKVRALVTGTVPQRTTKPSRSAPSLVYVRGASSLYQHTAPNSPQSARGAQPLSILSRPRS